MSRQVVLVSLGEVEAAAVVPLWWVGQIEVVVGGEEAGEVAAAWGQVAE